jgi:hypothetical protein
MTRTNTNAARERGVDAANTRDDETDHSAHSQGDKAFAMLLFNVGVCDLVRTQESFDQRPGWREA